MTHSSQRWLYGLWLLVIAGFAVLHALHLRADFPNHSPWSGDWAKYTDEGWYGNAAIRAHLLGNWYLPGDFNPAVAVPVWPFLEWLLFFSTGVMVEAARGLAVGFFFLNLLLSYGLLRQRGPLWMALLALTMMVTSPFLYCFGRLAILEPALTAFTLAALNLAVRLPGLRHPLRASVGLGLLCTAMVLTKTTAIFLLPGLGWAVSLSFGRNRRLALRSAAAAGGGFALSLGAWMALVAGSGLLPDYGYYFFVNHYPKPPEFYWPLVSFWWSLHGTLWVDRILLPLAGLATAGALMAWRSAWAGKLLNDPVFGASLWMVAGCIAFMTAQNHPQPRYFAVVAVFSFIVVAQAAAALFGAPAAASGKLPLPLDWAVLAVVGLAATLNGAVTLQYAAHPEYSFVDAARQLRDYIDQHPNGRRLLLSISGDEISLVTHLPALCDDFGTQDLTAKLAAYRPGWFATWNDIDPGTLEDLHHLYSLEQVASYRAFDDPERKLLVLFKLHPLPGGGLRDGDPAALELPLAGDKIEIPIQ